MQTTSPHNNPHNVWIVVFYYFFQFTIKKHGDTQNSRATRLCYAPTAEKWDFA